MQPLVRAAFVNECGELLKACSSGDTRQQVLPALSYLRFPAWLRLTTTVSKHDTPLGLRDIIQYSDSLPKIYRVDGILHAETLPSPLFQVDV